VGVAPFPSLFSLPFFFVESFRRLPHTKTPLNSLILIRKKVSFSLTLFPPGTMALFFNHSGAFQIKDTCSTWISLFLCSESSLYAEYFPHIWVGQTYSSRGALIRHLSPTLSWHRPFFPFFQFFFVLLSTLVPGFFPSFSCRHRAILIFSLALQIQDFPCLFSAFS